MQELEGKCYQYMKFKPLNYFHFFVLGRKLILIMTLVSELVVSLLLNCLMRVDKMNTTAVLVRLHRE